MFTYTITEARLNVQDQALELLTTILPDINITHNADHTLTMFPPFLFITMCKANKKF